ncbi:zinc finger protein basonuclin-2-like [Limulus polyphemus]|uniref:Zinc finger protein basonuclin-2-like n=1 Tax=Limulus polyphemus TaxID=6850 RepID=A0ABM1S7I4_LIMPO|nr:zinc finger protein basonuclin-2-like [Limulus polyphemus]
MSRVRHGYIGHEICTDGCPEKSRRNHSENGLKQRTSLVVEMAIRCTTLNCSCDAFNPGTVYQRICSTCSHGWVSHALDKMRFHQIYNRHQMELVQPDVAFDVASLMLYGTQAIPIRLKIPLDRLFSVLQHNEVLHVLSGFGWTYEDYARGYILQDPQGAILDRWTLASQEEEQLILQQFLRFGETKSIAHQLLFQETCKKRDYIIRSSKTDSDIMKFIEQTNRKVSTAILKNDSFIPLTTNLQSSHSLSTSSILHPRSSISPSRPVSSHGWSLVTPGSPLPVSPLNKIQNLQPLDYRLEKTTSEVSNHDILPIIPPTTFNPEYSPTSRTFKFSPALGSHALSITSTSKYSITDVGFVENNSTEMNLSQTANHTFDSVYDAKKVKRLRKSTNPMKRKWNSLVFSTVKAKAASKTRAQCLVCFKTFCDKGALKIHFSAVHLRETHKCLVEGCNKMFSSRRSRNRHSANLNPNLHKRNVRRKFIPHDDRSTCSLDMPPASPSNCDNYFIPECIESNLPKIINHPMATSTSSPSSIPSVSQPENLSGTYYHNLENYAIPLTTKCNLEENIQDVHMSNDLENVDPSKVNDSSSKGKNVHKRKSVNPVKFSITSEHDIQYISSDELSTHTLLDQTYNENEFLGTISDNHTPNFHCDFKQGGQVYESERKCYGNKRVKEEYRQLLEYPFKENEEQKVVTRKDTTEPTDLSKHPLQHLESLAMEAFTNIIRTTHNNIGLRSLHRVSHHASSLPLAMPQTCESSQSYSACSPLEHIKKSTASVAPNSQEITTGDHNSNPGDQLISFIPRYRDASMVCTVDVPIDKENPRRCVACGKTFQNHFSVKTHYQNVHLKLLHKCNVEGCTAAFPSKRSRDRHSTNLNLHRKLLSTDNPPSVLDKTNLYQSHPRAFRENMLCYSRALPLRLEDFYLGRIYGSEEYFPSSAFVNHLGAGTISPFHSAFLSPVTTTSTSVSKSLFGLSGAKGQTTSNCS